MPRTEASEIWTNHASRRPSHTEELRLEDLALAYGALMPAAHIPFSVSLNAERERAGTDRSI